MPMKIGDKARRLRRERLRLLHHPNVPLLPLPEVLLQVQARPPVGGEATSTAEHAESAESSERRRAEWVYILKSRP